MTHRQSSCNDTFEPGLMPVKDALARMLSNVNFIDDYESLNIESAVKRTLYEPVIAPFNVPMHNNAAVDGYALRSADLSGQLDCILEIAGFSFAGKPYTGKIKPGQCIRIMTGATVPEGADTIIMQEHVELQGDHIRIDALYEAGQNIRQAGEDLQLGQTVLQAGKFLTPPDIALLASVGVAEISVSRKLRVAIASTGNEVFSIGKALPTGGIYDSNRYFLLAALARPDIEIINLGILEDNPDTLIKNFQEAGDYADVIISTGGVSVGDADYTKMALQAYGQIDFWKVAMKPGRPLAFGKLNNATFFGLPGNPVAVAVTFYQFVLPALEKMLGVSNKPIAPVFLAQTTENLRKKPGRTEIQRGIIEQNESGLWTVKTTGNQGSGLLSSMSRANAFIILDHDTASVNAGEWVKVQSFSGLF